jgi:fluoride exporter
MSALVWLGAALLGGLGALARYHLDTLVQRRAAGELPVGTLAVNLLGSLCLGVLAGAGVGGDALLLAGAGLLGSFTTFSTWMLETERLAEEGEGALALVNLAASVGGGLAAALLGWAVGAGL